MCTGTTNRVVGYKTFSSVQISIDSCLKRNEKRFFLNISLTYVDPDCILGILGDMELKLGDIEDVCI